MFLKWNSTVAAAGDQGIKGMNKWVLAHLRNTWAVKHFHKSDGNSSNPLFRITNYAGSGMGSIIKLSSLLNSELERIL